MAYMETSIQLWSPKVKQRATPSIGFNTKESLMLV